jgi:energy-coupling factor transporter ATP-binding protein EcfA2
LATTLAVVAIPSLVIPALICAFFVGAVVQMILPAGRKKAKLSNEPETPSPDQQTVTKPIETPLSTHTFPNTSKCYRQEELRRVLAALRANNPVLVVGEEGSGKSELAKAIVQQLSSEEFTAILLEPASSKQVLINIAKGLEIDCHNLEGKALTADGLKQAIANYFEHQTAFLIFDDAQTYESKFRMWLKALVRQGVPILALATNPPKTDVFVNLPRIELEPLPEYAIRELMEMAALDKGISLKPHEMATLQERAGGNPMLAQRAIKEEHIGLEVEAGDHKRYIDITPLILAIGVLLIAVRFLARGIDDKTLYIISGVGGALFMGFSRVFYSLPKEGRRMGK